MSAAANLRPDAKRVLADVDGPLVLVGAGKMGSALLEGWLALGLDLEKLVVIEPQPSPAITAHTGLRLNPDLHGLKARAIVIAVKPQLAPDVVPTGITVAVANCAVAGNQRTLADRLLGATGLVEWVADETLLDAVTAVSGSGPAYVFLLAESLARAGAAAGLPNDLAERLARATVDGAGELLHRSTLDAATLRTNVPSPGGTTAAALEVLMDKDGLDPLLEKAVAAATQRSRDLAG